MGNLWILSAAGVCLVAAAFYVVWPRALELRAAQLRARGADRQAARFFAWALRVRISRHGDASLEAALVRTELARVRIQQNSLSEASEHLQAAAQAITTFPGKPSALLVSAMIGLGQGALEIGWHTEAARICRQARSLARRLLRGNDPQLGTLEALIGDVYVSLGDIGTAQAHYEKALERFRAATGEDSAECAEVLAAMAAAMIREQRWAEARETGVKAVEILDQTGGAALPRALSVLAALHAERGNLAEAESLRVSLCQLWERLGGPDSASLASEYERRAELLSRMQRTTEAGYLQRKAAQIRESLAAVSGARA